MTMELTRISRDVNEWLSGSGPLSDIVVSSRIRLARNLAGHRFPGSCSVEEKAEILEVLKSVLLSLDLGEEVFYLSLDKESELARSFLVERHLISRHHAMATGPRGAVIARNESFTAMLLEEDALRLQVLRSGCRLTECARQIDRIDSLIEERVEYAFNPRFGYLTACPTNVGTGIRVSVMLHMPALKMTGQIEKCLAAAKDMNFLLAAKLRDEMFALEKMMEEMVDSLIENNIDVKEHPSAWNLDNLNIQIKRSFGFSVENSDSLNYESLKEEIITKLKELYKKREADFSEYPAIILCPLRRLDVSSGAHKINASSGGRGLILDTLANQRGNGRARDSAGRSALAPGDVVTSTTLVPVSVRM